MRAQRTDLYPAVSDSRLEGTNVFSEQGSCKRSFKMGPSLACGSRRRCPLRIGRHVSPPTNRSRLSRPPMFVRQGRRPMMI